MDTLSVAAYDYRDGTIASFSSRGPSTLDGQLGVDVTAPGVGIRSSVPGGLYEGGWSGTSMAGPHVAGELALILSAAPELKGRSEELTTIVREHSHAKTSRQTCGGIRGSAIPNNVWGYGTIDAFAAVQSVRPAVAAQP